LACPHTGSDSDPAGDSGQSVASLQGSWYGTMVDSSLAEHTVRITIDGTGNVTSVYVDNSNQFLTGMIQKTSSKIFGLTLSDGTDAGFIVDPSGLHAGFLDSTNTFGVLQKGATSLPSYSAADIAGSWSGYGVTVDNNFELDQEFSSTVNVNTSLNFTGSDGLSGAFSGSIQYYHPAWGWYLGTYSNSSGSGDVLAFLSVDKTFVASFACENGVISNSTCSYTAWNKQ
jgi:carbon monoxide dehydrogenase subunit G